MRRSIALATHALLAPALLAGVALAGVTHDAPKGGWVGRVDVADQTASVKPHNTPGWDDVPASLRPGCTTPGHKFLPSSLLVSDREGQVTRYAYTDLNVETISASGANGDPGDDLYVVGMCR